LATDIPQRSYRAACPGCGAPVAFRSAQSTHAVCSYCRSTVVRSGETLSRVGRMAELFDDHSPLQLLAAGRFADRAFTLVGRLQYRSPSGNWTEWEAAFDDGTLGQLAEDNGAYVFSFPTEFQRELPPAERFRVGATTAVAGKPYTVTFNEQVSLVSAQGELPRLPPPGQPFAVVELRGADGEVLGIDYGQLPPSVSRGRAVRLEDLRLSGLREEAAREESGARHFACPHCGAQVDVQLEGTRSVTCRSCNSLIDLSQGVGGELRAAAQGEPVQPIIPLGSIGQLQSAQWQIVGFQHRLGRDPADAEQEQFGWSEYLLYNRKRGFLFLVDSEEGWSLVKPTTGAPQLARDGRSATYLGTRYDLKYTYQAETYFVAGEFYWPVERGQKTFNRDFARGRNLLSMEQSPREVSWSSGSAISAATVAAAFKLRDAELLTRGDAGPTTGGGGGGGSAGLGCGCLVFIVAGLVMLALLLSLFDRDGSAGTRYRSSGGSYGGWSSGGGGGK
jgi:DNA-directed RNA polymerase subunit RPC12/RpoP